MDKKHQKGHRERLRQRFINAGPGALHDYEIIELLLTYAIPLKDVKPIAKDLLLRFRNFQGVLDASYNELCEVKGVSSNSAALIRLIKETCSEYLAEKMKEKDALSSPEAVLDFAKMKISGLKDEAFLVIYLDIKNHVIDYEIISEGTIDQAVIYPRNIIRKAIFSNAAGLIVMHNHPSGICEPSKDDIKLTGAVRDAAKAVNIRIIDHVIVGKSGYFSFVREGLL